MISQTKIRLKQLTVTFLNGNYYGNEFPRLEMESKGLIYQAISS
jgi:hypothetical protein